MTKRGKKKSTCMTKNKAYDLTSYSFSPNEKILIDTNVWIYLFPPPSDPKYRHAPQYSNAFHKLISANALPIFDTLILSEYINRYIRTEWNAVNKSYYVDYKAFRNSKEFLPIAETAKKFTKKILSSCRIHSAPTNELDFFQALESFSTGKTDFNDAILVDICKKEGLKLMTNDGDFQDGGIEILTTNPRLLKACR